MDILSTRGDGDGERMLISDLIKALKEYAASVPAEVRATAYVCLTAYGDYASAQLEAGREETAAEAAAREDESRRWHASYEAEREAREAAEYARLKAKYEGT